MRNFYERWLRESLGGYFVFPCPESAYCAFCAASGLIDLFAMAPDALYALGDTERSAIADDACRYIVGEPPLTRLVSALAVSDPASRCKAVDAAYRNRRNVGCVLSLIASFGVTPALLAAARRDLRAFDTIASR